MIELFGSALVTFLVIIDPPGCAPIFASLTRGGTAAHRRAMAIRSSLIAWAILMFFAVLGKPLLQALGISLASFRIAGGIMLFLIAIDMVFERRTERREKRAEEVRTAAEVEDVSVFPLAIPMIAGPGSIATVMLLMSRAEGTPATLVILAALGCAMLLCLLALLAAGPIMRLVGAKAEAVVREEAPRMIASCPSPVASAVRVVRVPVTGERPVTATPTAPRAQPAATPARPRPEAQAAMAALPRPSPVPPRPLARQATAPSPIATRALTRAESPAAPAVRRPCVKVPRRGSLPWRRWGCCDGGAP